MELISLSAFGAKTPLRRAVVTEDFSYRCAANIQRFLFEKFQHDDQEHYFTIDPSIMEKLCENGEFFKIKDFQKQDMFAFYCNGEIQCKDNLCSCDKCLVGQFVHCINQKGQVVTGSFDNQSSDDSDSGIEYETNDCPTEDYYQLRGDAVIDAIDMGNTIALYSPQN